eukprot:745812-Hanusia_phi.AAC.3
MGVVNQQSGCVVAGANSISGKPTQPPRVPVVYTLNRPRKIRWGVSQRGAGGFEGGVGWSVEDRKQSARSELESPTGDGIELNVPYD